MYEFLLLARTRALKRRRKSFLLALSSALKRQWIYISRQTIQQSPLLKAR